MTDRLADTRCSVLDEDDVPLVAAVTGLSERTVRKRVKEAHGNTLLATLFVGEWPSNAPCLAVLTVSTARKARLDEELAAATGLALRTVRKRLEEGHGRTLLQNAFPELAAEDDKVDRRSDTREQPEPGATPANAPGMRDLRLDAPLTELGLPARLASFVERRELFSVRDLVAVPPAALLLERNLGRKTLADTHEALARHLGASWEEIRLAEGLDVRPAEDPPPVTGGTLRQRWDRLAGVLPGSLLDGPVSRVEVPTRIGTFATGSRIATLRSLLAIGLDELVGAPNLGRKTLADTVEALEAIAAAGPPVDPLTLHHRWLPLFQHALRSLPSTERLIITQRAGLLGPPPTLADLGELLGVSRERIRQLESRAMERVRSVAQWAETLRGRLLSLVDSMLLPLAELGGRDLFFLVSNEEEAAFAFFVEELLGSSLRVIAIEEGTYVSKYTKEKFAQRLTALRAASEELTFPIEESAIAGSLALRTGWDVNEARVFSQLLRSDWLRQGDLVVGFGNRREDSMLAFLRATPDPVSRAELDERFGRGKMPESVVFVDWGLVTVPQHVPDWERWGARVGPLCARLMEQHGPERQWTTAELLPLMAAEAELPAWCNAWTIGSLLRGRDEVRYLGRNVVALVESSGDRIPILETVIEILETAGKPLAEVELLAKLQRLRGLAGATWPMLRLRRPFLMMEGETIGLSPRDVPGGAPAIELMTARLISELERVERGLVSADLRELLDEFGSPIADWDLRLCRSVLRHDGRFRLAHGGSVGLSEWSDARAPTPLEALASLLADGDGEVRADLARSSIPTESGEPVTLGSLRLLAHSLGAEVSAETVGWNPEFPSAAETSYEDLVVNMPEVAATMFRRFVSEDANVLSVREELSTWSNWIRKEAETNVWIERDQVESVIATAERLLAQCERPDEPPRSVRAKLAAVRYLACVDDAESDAALGGLDDDEAVLAAVIDD